LGIVGDTVADALDAAILVWYEQKGRQAGNEGAFFWEKRKAFTWRFVTLNDNRMDAMIHSSYTEVRSRAGIASGVDVTGRMLSTVCKKRVPWWCCGLWAR
jgi:hypothetical protein